MAASTSKGEYILTKREFLEMLAKFDDADRIIAQFDDNGDDDCEVVIDKITGCAGRIIIELGPNPLLVDLENQRETITDVEELMTECLEVLENKKPDLDLLKKKIKSAQSKLA